MARLQWKLSEPAGAVSLQTHGPPLCLRACFCRSHALIEQMVLSLRDQVIHTAFVYYTPAIALLSYPLEAYLTEVSKLPGVCCTGLHQLSLQIVLVCLSELS